MNRLAQAFPRQRHVVLPVIHVDDRKQAMRNAEVARAAGADGVFLINHGIPALRLLMIHQAVTQEMPGWWVGVNCLDLRPAAVFATVTSDVAGIWVDNAEIDKRREDQPEAEVIQSARQRSGWPGLYFGGVAFKYQRPVEDLARAAAVAWRFMDVVTTSGPGTGEAASVDKIAKMKAALGDFPLAIASGITPDNVSEYLPCADCFLVATGISKNWRKLDPEKVEALIKTVRSANTRAEDTGRGGINP